MKRKIDTGDRSTPIKQRPYRISATERRVIKDEVQRMLKEDVIQPTVMIISSRACEKEER